MKLTNEQAIEIANSTFQNEKWIVVQPKEKWNGIDIMVEGSDRYIFQIDFRSISERRGISILRFYEDFIEHRASDDSYELFHEFFDNELIAEFMGLHQNKEDNGAFKIGAWYNSEYRVIPKLLYNVSWNWLMPACNKWDDLYKDDPVLRDRNTDTYSEYIELCDKLDNAVTTYEIHNAYLQLVSNIEWYNKQKS